LVAVDSSESSSTVTRQIPDRFSVEHEEFLLAGAMGDGLFSAGALGLEPGGSCTALYRGWRAHYGARGRKLCLREVEAILEAGGPPSINGVRARQAEPGIFDYEWSELGLFCPFTGRVLITRGHIAGVGALPLGYAVFPGPLEFECVKEVECRGGDIVGILDVSERIAALRATGLQAFEETRLASWDSIPPSEHRQIMDNTKAHIEGAWRSRDAELLERMAAYYCGPRLPPFAT
jgi:hypothetical protein